MCQAQIYILGIQGGNKIDTCPCIVEGDRWCTKKYMDNIISSLGRKIEQDKWTEMTGQWGEGVLGGLDLDTSEVREGAMQIAAGRVILTEATASTKALRRDHI